MSIGAVLKENSIVGASFPLTMKWFYLTRNSKEPMSYALMGWWPSKEGKGLGKRYRGALSLKEVGITKAQIREKWTF